MNKEKITKIILADKDEWDMITSVVINNDLEINQKIISIMQQQINYLNKKINCFYVIFSILFIIEIICLILK